MTPEREKQLMDIAQSIEDKGNDKYIEIINMILTAEQFLVIAIGKDGTRTTGTYNGLAMLGECALMQARISKRLLERDARNP